MKTDEHDDQRGAVVVAFRVPADLFAIIEAAAVAEGITKSAVARRAVIRDLRRTTREATA